MHTAGSPTPIRLLSPSLVLPRVTDQVQQQAICRRIPVVFFENAQRTHHQFSLVAEAVGMVVMLNHFQIVLVR